MLAISDFSSPWRRAFFEPRPGLALPGLHRAVVALDGTTLGLLHREPQAAPDAPDLSLAERDAVLALHEYADAIERPQPDAEAMVGGFVPEHSAQGLQLLSVQARWPPW